MAFLFFIEALTYLLVEKVTMDDIATAAGINKLNNVPNYAWAASDLAGQKSAEELLPLIDRAVRRGCYILRRLPDIVERMMLDARRRSSPAPTPGGGGGGGGGGGPSPISRDLPLLPSSSTTCSSSPLSHLPGTNPVDVNNVELYPFFTYHVKDLYNKFVDQTARALHSKCLDEFYGTRTIFWEYTE